eukprot:9174783-Pyramimonas_sp.AAC.1
MGDRTVRPVSPHFSGRALFGPSVTQIWSFTHIWSFVPPLAAGTARPPWLPPADIRAEEVSVFGGVCAPVAHTGIRWEELTAGYFARKRPES